MDSGLIERIIDQHHAEHAGLINILERIQAKFGYLPERALRLVSSRTGMSLVDIYGVATFYRSFSLEPKGRHQVSVCLGTACHVKAAEKVAEEFQKQLAIRSGETTPDREFSFETVNCLGACALGPIAVVDGQYFSSVKPTRVRDIIAKTRRGFDEIKRVGDPRVFPLDVACPRCNHSLLNAWRTVDGYPSIHVTASFHRKHGSLHLSCLYGSFNIESEYEIPPDTVVNVFCPHCHADLTAASVCPACDAPMVPMLVRGGGVVQICSRRGCHEHRLDLNGVNA